jgi:coproporphyrinogen III oxidase-like Fe-S oxidoreductase
VRGAEPPRELELLDADVLRRERLMLGLRLDEGLSLPSVDSAVDPVALARLQRLGLAHRQGAELVLTPRGRFLGGGVTAELLV